MRVHFNQIGYMNLIVQFKILQNQNNRGCTCTLTLPPSFDVGDERGTAEGFGYDGSVLDEDVVAVVSDDEDSAVGNWMG